MTIVEFLTARLDEQEADGRSLDYLQTGEFLVADAASKRAIITAEMNRVGMPWEFVDLATAERIRGRADSPVLRALASIYADHPDYNPEWKP